METDFNPMQFALVEWHRTFGVVVGERPSMADEKTRQLRKDLIEEEFRELREALDSLDIVGTADAIGDLLYVVFGTAVSLGINIQPIFDEIHRSNMSKRWPDGTVHYAENGKVLKPPTYSPADLLPLLVLQGADIPAEEGETS